MEIEAARTIIDLNGIFKKNPPSRGYSTFSVNLDKNEKKTPHTIIQCILNDIVWLIFERNFKVEGYIVTCLTSV